jgi:ATP-dependent RNA helicase RhlE
MQTKIIRHSNGEPTYSLRANSSNPKSNSGSSNSKTSYRGRYSAKSNYRGNTSGNSFHSVSRFPKRFNKFNKSNKGKGSKIDVSRYINTNVTPVKVITYVPKHNFVDFEVEKHLKENIVSKGYVVPTPIQDQAIPVVLSGKDIVGIANTGTGKTAAFLIPLINKVLLGKDQRVLIVAPTRELAHQINDELKSFTRKMKMYSVVVVGGSPIGAQIRELRYYNDFVIGTPGRIKDVINRGVLNLAQFQTVVLDEADRMLDMGFIDDMRFMMDKMPKNRHTLFFSATLSSTIEVLIKDFLNDPVRISVKTGDTSKNILQDAIRIKPGTNKTEMLHDLLNKEEFEKVLVFGKTKHGVQKLSDELYKRGFSSSSIHGDKNQIQRQRALNDFKTNKTKILVATDVAARGLDIPNVSHVINYDLPATHEDYIHRIGRTGRGDKTGKALTFID